MPSNAPDKSNVAAAVLWPMVGIMLLLLGMAVSSTLQCGARPEAAPNIDQLLAKLETGGPTHDEDVRLAALESLAAAAGNNASLTPAEHAALLAAALRASAEESPRIRGTAAFTLGALGDAEALRRLAEMLGDATFEVRCNAATGLARWGNAAGCDVLAEMLDVRRIGPDRQPESAVQRAQQQMIVVAALRATERLATLDTHSDLSRLSAAIDKLYVADVDAALLLQATGVLQKLKARRPADPAPATQRSTSVR